jgi:Fur family peroxide stress response transcriptional regulator
MPQRNITELLTAHALKVTPQRVAVLEFLHGNPTHPSVDDVYQQVRRRLPYISRATIYNTVATLVEAGLLQEILIQQERTHVDGNLHPHHHFKCVRCDNVEDIEYDVLTPDRASRHMEGYQVTGVKLVMEGVCRDCK